MQLILVLFLISSVVSPAAQAQIFDVLVRTPNGKWKIEKKIIDLKEGATGFETDHFKIVNAKSNDALVLEPQEPGFALKAATALYHLEKAYHFYAEELQSVKVRALSQTTVRIELTNRFSELGHFMHDNREPQFNNALSIPAGRGFEGQGIEPWKEEIWFRPVKEISTSDILNSLSEDPMNETIRQIREAIYPMQLENSLRTSIYYLFSPLFPRASFLETMTRQAGTVLLTEGALQVSRLLNRAMLPDSYYLDTVMVPEIIYHEFSHIALSDSLELSHSTPVNEGMADFFAASISKSPKLAQKIKKFSTALGKNGSKKEYFRIEFESLSRANSDFVLGLLWGLRPLLGEDVTPRVVFEARKHLSTQASDIRTGLVRSILLACDAVCFNPTTERLRLLQYFQDRGL